MSDVDKILDDVERLNASAAPADAQYRLLGLIETMSSDDLELWDRELRVTIAKFLKKRRADLTDALDQKLGTAPLVDAANNFEGIQPPGLAKIEGNYHAALQSLSDFHIFQWSTFYRDTFDEYFDQFFDALTPYDSWGPALESIRSLTAAHSEEIFTKGGSHTRATFSQGDQYVLPRAVGGLQGFLEIPVDLYAVRMTSGTQDVRQGLLCRAIASSFAAGILEGFCRVPFNVNDVVTGGEALTRYPKNWTFSLAFLTGNDIGHVLDLLPAGKTTAAIAESIAPAMAAVDELALTRRRYAVMPVLSQFDQSGRRLDIGFQPPAKSADRSLIYVRCLLGEEQARFGAVDLAGKELSLILGPLPEDVAKSWERDVGMTGKFPDREIRSSPKALREFIKSKFDAEAMARRQANTKGVALQYNFARTFPITNPHVNPYYFVDRPSVRDLLNTFEQRTGVRLWCSVRRSGKTTACLDLSSATGNSTVVSQTCDSTREQASDTTFYNKVNEALESGRGISQTFFSDAVVECTYTNDMDSERYVFILDEYETLFGRIESACIRDAGLRYTVAQPLLNQMASFASTNLLVLLGQQPNAHLVLMDQNQLSPYVEQDAFPLFQTRTGGLSGEFPALVRKVLTDQVNFDAPFLRAVERETSGHPYLTVNLLVEFVDWLIEKKRKLQDLDLTAKDFASFSDDRLTQSRIAMSRELEFFRGAASEAMGEQGRLQSPWLHGIYTSLAFLQREFGGANRCTRADFFSFCEEKRFAEIGIWPEDILQSGELANFLMLDSEFVRPKIQLLGRIAAATRPKLHA